MSSFTNSQLENMMRDLESDRVERKESFRGDAPTKIREAVCAFANDLPGHGEDGVILIGVDDAGVPVAGFQVTDELLLSLADMKTDGNIVPPPSILVEKRTLCNVDIVVVSVKPCDTPPARYKGRIHVRWGPRRGLATAQDERILNERRRHLDRPFDVQPLNDLTIRELDLIRFNQEYLPALVARDVLEANDRSDVQRLAATKMIASDSDPRPTVLAVLVIGTSTADYIPGAYIQFVRFAGTDLTAPVVDEMLIFGTVSDQIRMIEEKLSVHNMIGVRFANVAMEESQAMYPMDALRQLVRNAVMHRSYESTNAPVKVYWFNDRLEIHNPGGPFGSVTRENFGHPGSTDYRNPNLAESLRALGYVQRFGAGIAIARKILGDRLHYIVEIGTIAAVIKKDLV